MQIIILHAPGWYNVLGDWPCSQTPCWSRPLIHAWAAPDLWPCDEGLTTLLYFIHSLFRFYLPAQLWYCDIHIYFWNDGEKFTANMKNDIDAQYISQ